MVILEGPQDIGRSMFCKAIVPNPRWFTDTAPDIGNKDSMESLRGILIQEHAEMATLNKSDANKIKAFISSDTDRFRLAYGRLAQNFPRQCIFIATVNPGANGYLKDETGGSRFWPVKCAVG